MVMHVELDMQTSPLLWAELIKCKKGFKRVQRLRDLALIGAVFERNQSGGPSSQPPASPSRAPVLDVDGSADMFESIKEDAA
jgi:hypothetical protein